MGVAYISASKKTNEAYKWGSNISFLFAMIGAAIGLGNIWRFSYIVYSNGGGSFFIPYIFAILTLGVPFLILEYGLGVKHRDSLSSILKNLNPKFEVIGWFIVFLVFLVMTYYIVIIGWDVIYLLLGFTKQWGSDPNLFFNTNIVVGGNNLSHITTIVWPTFIIVTLVWIFLWLVSRKNIENGIGKVVKITIPSLICIMFLIVAYSFTLNGHMIGLTNLFNPDWSALLNSDIWLAAFTQVLFSLSVGQSIALTYASYLDNNDHLVDSVLVVAASNSSFEIITAIGVFNILGFMSLKTGLGIEQIATSGTGLIFVVFPEIFNIMGDVAYIIGPAFFLCVFFAGVTTMFAFIEPMSLSLAKKFKMSRSKTATIVCFFGFLTSIIFTTGAGNYILAIADEFINQYGILFAILLQAIIFGWLYGIDKLVPILNEKSIVHIGSKWIWILKYILPGVLLILFASEIIHKITEGITTELLIELVFLALIIIIPVILTKLPETKDN